MVKITVEEFQNAIETGNVYYFSDSNIKSGEPHYCILINKNPQKETFLIFVPATTLDIWSATSAEKYPKETIVSLTPKKCPFLRHDSLFDCNRPIVRHVDVLTAKAAAGELKIKAKVSIEIVEKLQLGIMGSKLVSNNVKKMLEGQ
ncbi:MAG: hypothetical protein Q8P06_01750 [Candidatus Azambacteria bacterium]|nr:hypothetical protein [Candidatus Azambacteria bacterium]